MIRKQFALLIGIKVASWSSRRFKLAIRKYLNGIEEKDIMHIFQHFDRDNSKTLSVEEFSDLLLKEAGPHNYSYKEYNKAIIQAQSEDGKTKLYLPALTAKRQTGPNVSVVKQENNTAKLQM